MLDPTLLTAASATLEAIINKALQYDPATLNTLETHFGKSLAVEITELDFILCFHFGRQVMVTNYCEDPTIKLQGSIPALISLALSDSTNLAKSGVCAKGNTAFLAEIKSIARRMDIDWEDAINQWLGDVVGHQVAGGIRRQFGWINDRRVNSERLLKEFLTEELRATPSQPELETFNSTVDQLYLKTDRLSARIQQLDATLRPTPQATDKE
jgi:ubiquinone biosynthesis protein UbiJ